MNLPRRQMPTNNQYNKQYTNHRSWNNMNLPRQQTPTHRQVNHHHNDRQVNYHHNS